MDEAELRRLLAEKTEGFRVEYKREISDPMKLAKSVAALANAQGGSIFIGVEESPNELPLSTGVKNV